MARPALTLLIALALSACAQARLRAPAAIPASRSCSSILAELEGKSLKDLLPLNSERVFARVGRENIEITDRKVKTVARFNESRPNLLSFQVEGEERWLYTSDIKGLGERTVRDNTGSVWDVMAYNGDQLRIENKRWIITRDTYFKEEENLVDLTLQVTLRNGKKSRISVKMPNFTDPKAGPLLEGWLLDLFGSLPERYIEDFKDFTLSPGAFDRGFNTRGLFQSDGNKITIFMGKTERLTKLQEVSWHEYGHFLAKRVYGSTNLDYAYSQAAKADGTIVSDYGATEIAEDFAEAMRVYFVTDGGRTSPKLRDRLHNRFKIIDKIVKANPDAIEAFMSEFYAMEAEELKKRRFVYVVVGGGAIGMFITARQVHAFPLEAGTDP